MQINGLAATAAMRAAVLVCVAAMHGHSASAYDLDTFRAYIQISHKILIEQPERHFYFENYAFLHALHPESEPIEPCVYKLAVDLNDDGQPEYFFSTNNPMWRNARQGQLWLVYVSSPEGYRQSRNGFSFWRSGIDLETNQGARYLLRFASGGGKVGVIVRIRATNGDLVEENLGRVSVEDPTTFEGLLEQLDDYDLDSTTLEPIEDETISVEYLQQTYPDVNENTYAEFVTQAVQQYNENE